MHTLFLRFRSDCPSIPLQFCIYSTTKLVLCDFHVGIIYYVSTKANQQINTQIQVNFHSSKMSQILYRPFQGQQLRRRRQPEVFRPFHGINRFWSFSRN
jgi:hypothetical protein